MNFQIIIKHSSIYLYIDIVTIVFPLFAEIRRRAFRKHRLFDKQLTYHGWKNYLQHVS